MSQMPVTRVVLALLGWVILPGSEFVDAPFGEAAPQGVQLMSLNDAQALSSAYTLPIASVPPVPAVLLAPRDVAPGDVEAPTCPFDLRAVVVGEAKQDSFAMVMVDEESRLVHAGESLLLRGVKWLVESLASNAVTLRVGERRVTCGLSQ